MLPPGPLPGSSPWADGRAGHGAATRFELGHYLPNQLLRDTDTMSMAHSLEVRVPLLDDSVVRVALALPASVRLAQGKVGKSIRALPTLKRRELVHA